MAAPFRYRLFGLTIASDFDLPELRIAAPSDAVDVHVARDPDTTIGDSGADPLAIEGGFEIRVTGIAAFEIRGGNEVRVAADPSAAPANVRLYLLGSAMGMLLHQRGLLPLHANAVVIDGRAVAFLGRSGTGKSTLAAWFADRGFAVVSDDVCAIHFGVDGHPRLSPGLPRLRLWRDALERSGRAPGDYPPSYSGDPDYDKFDVALPLIPQQQVPLTAIVDLRWGEVPSLFRLEGLAAVEVLMANTYRGAFVALLGRQQAHLQACVDLAAAVPVFALDRVKGFELLDGELERLIERFRAGGAETE